MAFRCPYCQFRIAVKTPPKPGRYTPTCPKCQAKMALTVPPDVVGDWSTAKIQGETPILPPETQATSPAIGQLHPVSQTRVAGVEPDATEAMGENSAPNDVTAVTGDVARPRSMDDQTAIVSPSEETPDRTAMFGVSSKTETGESETIARTGVEYSAKKSKKKGILTDVDIPNTLGGYEVVREIGHGGMGAVYLARQISLDRAVALKVMNSKWASDPIFLARFTREAFAAAQLVHHNVVQIYDIGEQQGINFFSMEFVDGKSLGEMLKRDGKVPVEVAVGYVLQAARGLKFAHERGMIHRDVKPDNLMLNVHGIVKVADLGLVKTPTMTAEDDVVAERSKTDPDIRKSMSGLRSLPSDITMARTAMGSPAYMSPEQCKDASTVDPRADIYSLGCTFYALLAGKPPFQGGNALDVMAKHATEPPKPIGEMPSNVNACVLKSLAKEPADRQQSMDEFLTDLERLLPEKGESRGPTSEHVAALEGSVQKFESARMGKVRRTLIPAFYLGGTVAAFIGLFVSGIVTAAVIALMFETTLAYLIIDGLFGKSYLFRRIREWAFGARLGDWAIAGLGFVIFVLVLWLIGLLWVWVGTGVLAVGIAFLFHFVVDRTLAAQRRPAIEDCEKMLRRLRVGGMDEETLRLFVASNAGRNWEPFYEAMFGYESKLVVRPAVEAQTGSRSPRNGAWRDALVARIDRALQVRREARTRKVLQRVEAKKLEAEGVNKRQAAAQAEAAAAVMVEQAAEIQAAKKKPLNVREMLARAQQAPKRTPKPASYRIKKVFGAVFGWKARFVVGVLLIAAGALWVRTQIKFEQVTQAAGNVASAQTDEASQAAAKQAARSFSHVLTRENPLNLAIGGTRWNWVDCLNPLVAGLILVLSSFNRRGSGVAIQLIGATFALFGHTLGVIPIFGPVEPHQTSMIVGLGLAVLGVVVSRK